MHLNNTYEDVLAGNGGRVFVQGDFIFLLCALVVEVVPVVTYRQMIYHMEMNRREAFCPAFVRHFQSYPTRSRMSWLCRAAMTSC